MHPRPDRESGTAGDARRKGATDVVAVQASTRYTGTFHGRAEEVRQVRREIADYLGGCPVADDIVLIASELAANAILHTQSRGSTFTVRCHAGPGQVRIETEDLGGPWRRRNTGDRPHGLDIIEALTGPDGWGTEPAGTGGRTVWARLTW
jgi:Histidine kinase-like ATPase domain